MAAKDNTKLNFLEYTNLTPADILFGSTESKIGTLLKFAKLETQNRIPAYVVSYDAASNMVLVQPAIKDKLPAIKGNILYVDRPRVLVPMRQPFGNDCGIRMFAKEGDTGWLYSSDREWKAYLDLADRTKTVVAPSLEACQFRFGYFALDAFNGITFSSEDEKCLAIQTKNGNTRIVIDPETEEIRVTSSLTTFNGNLKVNGKIEATGDIVSGTISAQTHTHTTTTTGAETSEPH